MVQGIEGLPEDTLAEIADSVYFVRRRVLVPENLQAEILSAVMEEPSEAVERGHWPIWKRSSPTMTGNAPSPDVVADMMTFVFWLSRKKVGPMGKAAFERAEWGEAIWWEVITSAGQCASTMRLPRRSPACRQADSVFLMQHFVVHLEAIPCAPGGRLEMTAGPRCRFRSATI